MRWNGVGAVGRVVILAGVACLPSGAEIAAQTVEARGSTITFGGRVHAQYFQTSVDDGPPKDLFFRRVRLTADIVINEYLDARIMPDFAGGNTALQDAYIRLKLSPSFRVSVGQFKRAFDLFEMESSTQLPLTERDGRIPGLSACDGVGGTCSFSRMTEKLQFAGRDAGIRVDGALGDGATYMLTVTNGEGVNVGDVNQGKSVSGRVVFDAGDNAQLGVFAGTHDVFDEEAAETSYANGYGVDAKVGSYGGGTVVMASVVRGENWKAEDASGTAPTFWAGQVTGSYYAATGSEIVQGVEPMLRVSTANPNTDATDVGGVLVTPGAHFYFQGRNRFGVNADVFSPSLGDTEYSLKFMMYLYF